MPARAGIPVGRAVMTRGDAFLPERVPIDAYGNGGFRFGGLSHRGSLLLLPSGVYGWPIARFEEIGAESFALVFAETEPIDVLLLGCGEAVRLPATALRRAFADRRIGLEAMSTGAAARTYNVLLAELRRVAAALIAVEAPR
jgi:uncharacterized protein